MYTSGNDQQKLTENRGLVNDDPVLVEHNTREGLILGAALHKQGFRSSAAGFLRGIDEVLK